MSVTSNCTLQQLKKNKDKENNTHNKIKNRTNNTVISKQAVERGFA